MRHLLVLLMIGTIAATAHAGDVAFSFPFSDHMVIQRGSTSIWGRAPAGEKVIVTFRDATAEAVADDRCSEEFPHGSCRLGR